MEILIYILLALFISMSVIAVMWQLAPRIGMIDKPDPRKVHTKPVARVGGVGIVIGALIPLVMLLKIDPLLQSFLLGSVILLIFGMLDDALELGHYPKFVGQIAAVLLVIYYGDLYVHRLPYFFEFPPGLGKFFTAFAMIGMINAINHSDGLDGLAGGETLLSLIVIALLGLSQDSIVTFCIAGAVIGGILGFLRFNTHPAQIFMGDSGSQFLGFSVAFLAVYLTQRADLVMSAALPLLFLGLPIIDILAVLFLRIKGGMNWFKATRNHIHHRLLDLGFDHYETVVIIYSIQATLVISSLFMRYEWDSVIIGTYAAVCISVFLFLTVAERKGWRAHTPGEKSRLTRFLDTVKNSALFKSLPLQVIGVLVPVYIVAGSLFATKVPNDFGMVSIFSLGLLAVLMFVRVTYLYRGIIYAVAMFIVYLGIYYSPDTSGPVQKLEIVIFFVLFVAIAVAVRFDINARFKATPMDYLVLFMIFIVGILAERYLQNHNLTLLFIKGCIILYGCEITITSMRNRWNRLNLSVLVTLLVLGTRGLLM